MIQKNDMWANAYQRKALRTAQTDKFTKDKLLLNAALRMCGESGEVADEVKKFIFQGHDIDPDHIAKEIGDVLWYAAVGAYALGMDLGEIMRLNIEKLKKDIRKDLSQREVYTVRRAMYDLHRMG